MAAQPFTPNAPEPHEAPPPRPITLCDIADVVPLWLYAVIGAVIGAFLGAAS